MAAATTRPTSGVVLMAGVSARLRRPGPMTPIVDREREPRFTLSVGARPVPALLPSILRGAETRHDGGTHDDACPRRHGRRRAAAPGRGSGRGPPRTAVASVAAAVHLERDSRRRAVRLRLPDAVPAAPRLGAPGP